MRHARARGPGLVAPSRVVYPGIVTVGARKLVQDALALSSEERVQVAEELLDSVDEGAHVEIDEAWRAEILRRVQQVRRGEVEPMSWESVRAHGRAALARQRGR